MEFHLHQIYVFDNRCNEDEIADLVKDLDNAGKLFPLITQIMPFVLWCTFTVIEISLIIDYHPQISCLTWLLIYVYIFFMNYAVYWYIDQRLSTIDIEAPHYECINSLDWRRLTKAPVIVLIEINQVHFDMQNIYVLWHFVTVSACMFERLEKASPMIIKIAASLFSYYAMLSVLTKLMESNGPDGKRNFNFKIS